MHYNRGNNEEIVSGAIMT